MEAVTHLEKVIVGEVSAVTHLEKVIAGETSAVTYTEKVIAGEATPITHLQRVIAGEASPVTHLEYVWAGRTPEPTEHEYTGAVPYTFRADGSPLISWRISGNTVQNGTPTPQNPVMPNGTGERTGNLFDKSSDVVGYYIATNTGMWTQTGSMSRSVLVKCEPNTTYTIYVKTNRTLRAVYFNNFPSAGDVGYGLTDNTTADYINKTLTITTGSSAQYLAFFCYNSAQEATMYNEAEYFSQVMLNKGSTALPYEPYGYKIPISSANTTTPVYLGKVQSTRRIRKLVLTGDEIWDRVDNCFRLSLSNSSNKVGTIISTHFEYKIPWALINTASVGACVSTTYYGTAYKFLMIRCDDIATTAADFKSYLSAQYAAGTPVTIWYVLATEETAVVNEPLMKIGDYADEVSNVATIPTNNGSTTIDVETTVKPSEVYIKYKGV